MSVPASSVGYSPTLHPPLMADLPRLALLICLALIPCIAITLPADGRGSSDHAGFVDLAAVPILLILCYRQSVARSVVLLLLLGFLCTAALSLFTAGGHPLREILRIYRLYAIYTPFILALSIPWSLQQVQSALRFFWWSGLIGIGLGMAVFWVFGAVRENQQQLWIGDGGGAVYRAGGLLGNSGGFSHLITGWAMVALCLRGMGLGQLPRWQLMVTLAVFVYGLTVTASRASLLQASVALILAGLLVAKADRSQHMRLMRFSMTGLSMVLLCAPLLLLVVDARVLEAVGTRFGLGEDASRIVRSSRYAHWSSLLESLGWNPLGIGYKRTTDLTGLQVDNSYLRIFLELGIPGIVFYLGFWGLAQINLVRTHADPRIHRLRSAAAGMLTGELARMMFSDVFTMYLSTPITLIVLGMMLRLGHAPPSHRE